MDSSLHCPDSILHRSTLVLFLSLSLSILELKLGLKNVYSIELITFEILAAKRLRLMRFDNRLIIDCFANVVNILIWLFSTNDRFRSEKYESNYLENPFPEMKGVNLLSKTHRNDKSNLKPRLSFKNSCMLTDFPDRQSPLFSAAIPFS